MSAQRDQSDGWRTAKVGDVFEVIGGGTPSTKVPDYWAGDIPWVTSADLRKDLDVSPRRFITRVAIERSATNLVPKDSVIVATRVGLGKVAVANRSTCFSQDCQALLPSPKAVMPRFIAHQLSVATREFLHTGRGTTITGVTKKQLLDLEIRYPDVPRQRLIVEKIEELFSDLDAGVGALERAKANLARYRAAVLKAAVEGRLTEQWRREHPDVEPASELLKRALVDRRTVWEDQELAKYAARGKRPPKGWRAKYKAPAARSAGNTVAPRRWAMVSLGQVALFQNGRAFPSKEYSTVGTKLLRPGNLYSDGSVRWTVKNTRCMPPEWEQRHPDYVVGGGELVMNLTAQSLADEFLGRVCLTDVGERCLLNQRLARITPMNGVTRQYVLYVLKSQLFRRFVSGLNTGSLIQHMFTSDLTDFTFPLPPTDEQREIVGATERYLDVVDRVHSDIGTQEQRVAGLRQSVLRSAFAGGLPGIEGAPS